MKTKIRIDPETGFAYISKGLRQDGLVGEVVALADARTITLIVPGTRLADVKRSLETIISDIELRMRYEEGPESASGKTERKVKQD